MEVFVITKETALLINGKFFNDTTTFNPIQLNDSEYFFTFGEIGDNIEVDEMKFVNNSIIRKINI